MATTNKKQFIEQVQAHILESIDESETIQSVYASFQDWNKYEKNNLNAWQRFTKWLYCLPGEIYITPYFEEQKELFKEWVENTGEIFNSKKYNKTHFENIVSREFFKLYKKAVH